MKSMKVSRHRTHVLVCSRGGGKKSIHLTISILLKQLKNVLVYLRINLYLIILLFLRGVGENLPILFQQRAKCLGVFDLKQHRAD